MCVSRPRKLKAKSVIAYKHVHRDSKGYFGYFSGTGYPVGVVMDAENEKYELNMERSVGYISYTPNTLSAKVFHAFKTRDRAQHEVRYRDGMVVRVRLTGDVYSAGRHDWNPRDTVCARYMEIIEE